MQEKKRYKINSYLWIINVVLRKKLRNKRLKNDFRMIERMAVAFHRVYKGWTARRGWILKAYQPEFNKGNPLLKIDNRNAGIILLLHSVAFLKNIRRFEMRFMDEVSNTCIYLCYQVGKSQTFWSQETYFMSVWIVESILKKISDPILL